MQDLDILSAKPGRATAYILAAWLAVAVLQIAPDLLSGIHWNQIASKAIETLTWAPLTPAVILFDKRIVGDKRPIRDVLLLHLGGSIIFSTIHTYVAALLLYPVRSAWWNPLTTPYYAIYFYIGGWVTYCAIIGIIRSIRFHSKFLVAELCLVNTERRLLESRLDALRLRIEPHFLFNSLNSISADIVRQPEVARKSIESLSILLRYYIAISDRHEVCLSEEIALLTNYADLQSHRFGNRVTFSFDVDNDAAAAIVPPLLLQPLVENSVRHGVEPLIGGGEVAVSACRQGDWLNVEVLDNGIGLPPSWKPEHSMGLGLRVTRERLSAVYGDQFSLTLSRQKSGGTAASVRIPYRDFREE